MNFFKAHICKLLFANIMNLFFSSYLLQRYFLLLFVFLLFFAIQKSAKTFLIQSFRRFLFFILYVMSYF